MPQFLKFVIWNIINSNYPPNELEIWTDKNTSPTVCEHGTEQVFSNTNNYLC
jgi:hypothetical protein